MNNEDLMIYYSGNNVEDVREFTQNKFYEIEIFPPIFVINGVEARAGTWIGKTLEGNFFVSPNKYDREKND